MMTGISKKDIKISGIGPRDWPSKRTIERAIESFTYPLSKEELRHHCYKSPRHLKALRYILKCVEAGKIPSEATAFGIAVGKIEN